MKPNIITIGVYGFDEEHFFQALLAAHVDTFCDIRRRRGLRGSLYAFANSANLQRRLNELGIRYHHTKDLAPDAEIREQQKVEDKQLGIAKRTRSVLSQGFIQAYEQRHLATFDSQQFLDKLGPDTGIIALFCVERDPEACHRSLAAAKLARDLGVYVEHIRP